MEFKHSKPERRHDRRICPKCNTLNAARLECKNCGAKTEARIRIIWYVDGKRYRQLTQCWREEDANALLQRKEADYWRQQDFGVEREIGGTIREAFKAFQETRKHCSVNYQKQLRTSVSALAAGIGWDTSVTLLSARHLAQYKADGLQTLSPSTVRSYMVAIRQFTRFMVEEGWIRRDPALKVKLPPARRGRDHLRPEEVGPVLQGFWEHARDYAALVTALVLGGWRKGELVNLRRQDVNLETRWAYVIDFEGDQLASAWSPKTESSRRAVPLHPIVARAFERVEPVAYPDGTLSPWMFPVLDKRKTQRYFDKDGRSNLVRGDRRSPGTVFFGRKLRVVLDLVGIKRRVTIHGLRRTFAVLLQEAGAPDTVIRQALGHGARGVTECHYLPRRDENVQRWVDAIKVTVPALAPVEAPQT